MFTLWNITFPVKCPNPECNGKCSYNIKVGNNYFCSQYNLLMRCINKTGERDFHLYWSFELNPNINPLLLARGTLVKFWFRCPVAICNHHVWQGPIKKFNSKSRCPFCTSKQTCPCDSAANRIIDLASYWHQTKNTISPYEISPGSGIKVWFKCPAAMCNHHEWETTMTSFNRGNRCPFCTGKQTCPCDSAANQVIDLISYWHPTKNTISPYEIVPGSDIKVWFKCPIALCIHHEWEGTMDTFTRGGRCPFCRGLRTCPCDSAANQVIDLASYWHHSKNTISPYEISPNCNAKFWFKCSIASCGHHEWEGTMNNFTAGKRCPFCTNRKTCPCDSAANQIIDLVSYWHQSKNIVSPYEIGPSANIKVWFKCPVAMCNHHEWEAKISEFNTGNRCPFCINRKTCPCDSAANNVKDLTLYWHPTKNIVSPYEISAGSGIRVWFKCPVATCNHHEWETAMGEFTRGSRCPFCSIHKTCTCDSTWENNINIKYGWNRSLNKDIDPRTIAQQSGKTFWFNCLKNKHPPFQRKMQDYFRSQSCPQCITTGSSRKEKIIVRVFEIYLNQASVSQYRTEVGKIDGYFPSANVSVEFHGCFWHGCSKCFPNREEMNSVSNLTYQELYNRTVERDARLRQLFNHQVIWECEIEPYLNSPRASIPCVNSIYSTKQLYEMACQQIQDDDLDVGNLPTDILSEEDFQRFDTMQALADCAI